MTTWYPVEKAEHSPTARHTPSPTLQRVPVPGHEIEGPMLCQNRDSGLLHERHPPWTATPDISWSAGVIAFGSGTMKEETTLKQIPQ